MNLPHHDVAIVGAGFAGLGMAIELQRHGQRDYVVLEKAEAVGGTWHANHYPGCACDVPTPYYSYSFAPKPDWSRFYAGHEEIRAYLEELAARHHLREHIRLNTEVTAARWDDDAARWELDIDGEPALTARVAVMAPGGLSRPAYPDLPGLSDFTGPWFHSAEWDHTVDLRNARVAVVGTGASAIQFVPQVARQAAALDVYQRTPPWILPKPDRRISDPEQALYRRWPATQRAMRGLVWAMQEYQGLANTRLGVLARPLELIGRAHIRRHIDDPALIAQLTPDYRIGCKRILLANDWYSTLAQAHVNVVGTGIDRVTERGLRTRDGAEHPADVIVFGTGFKVNQPLGEVQVSGRGGVDLRDTWSEGLSAHRGTTVAGFPNLFIMPGPNTGTGHTSQVFMIETQIRHVLAALRRTREHGACAIEPRADAQRRWNERLQKRMQGTVWLQGGCTSWYLDAEGRNTTLWPWSSPKFRLDLLRIDDLEYLFHRPPVRHITTAPTAGHPHQETT